MGPFLGFFGHLSVVRQNQILTEDERKTALRDTHPRWSKESREGFEMVTGAKDRSEKKPGECLSSGGRGGR